MGVKYDKILSMLPGVEVTHPVGVYHNYQNVAFSLAGDVMEDVSGQSFAQLLETAVQHPPELINGVGHEKHGPVRVGRITLEQGVATLQVGVR